MLGAFPEASMHLSAHAPSLSPSACLLLAASGLSALTACSDYNFNADDKAEGGDGDSGLTDGGGGVGDGGGGDGGSTGGDTEPDDPTVCV